MRIYSGVARNRRQDLNTAFGLTDRPDYFGGSGAVPTSQTIFGHSVYLYAGETVSNIICCVTTAASGTTPTSLRLGLWDSGTPTCLAVTPELSADSRWTSTAWKVNALSANYQVPTDGVYYAAFFINGVFGTTNLQLLTVNLAGQINNLIGSGKRPTTSLKTAAASMAAGDTGTYGAGVVVPWLGVS